jgi:hypothetical protein
MGRAAELGLGVAHLELRDASSLERRRREIMHMFMYNVNAAAQVPANAADGRSGSLSKLLLGSNVHICSSRS